MHKKLLLVMLVPILAFSFVVTGCGSDDGPFDGDPTFRGIQGPWVSDWQGSERWFLITANQLVMMNPDTVEGGLAFRTEFRVRSHADITDRAQFHFDVDTISQDRLLTAMNWEIARWHNAGRWWAAGAPTPFGVTYLDGAGGFVFPGAAPGDTFVPGLRDAMVTFFGENRTYRQVGWATINSLNALMLGNVSGAQGRTLENYFRGLLLGNNYAARFAHDNLMRALTGAPITVGSEIELHRQAIGFGDGPGAAGTGTLGPLGIDNTMVIFRDPPGAGTTAPPRTVVAFTMEMRCWDTNAHAGALHGLWVNPAEGASNTHEAQQRLVFFSSEIPYFWQDNLPIPIGVFSRQSRP